MWYNDETEFHRVCVFRLENGLTVRIAIPESVYQERCAPHCGDPKAYESVLKELIMDAMKIEQLSF